METLIIGLAEQLQNQHEKSKDINNQELKQLDQLQYKLSVTNKKTISYDELISLKEAWSALLKKDQNLENVIGPFPKYLDTLIEKSSQDSPIHLSKINNDDFSDLRERIFHLQHHIERNKNEEILKIEEHNSAYFYILKILIKITEHHIQSSNTMIKGLR